MHDTINTNSATIRDLVDAITHSQPERVFLIGPETKQTITFKQLQIHSRLLHARYERLGLVPGDKIAFLMDNGLIAAQAFLGTIYGGFVAVPLNLRAGLSQLAYTLDHCDAKAVLLGPEYGALFRQAVALIGRPVEAVQIAASQAGGCSIINV